MPRPRAPLSQETAVTTACHIDGQPLRVPALAPGLYVVATPIGNMGDITVRALQTLAAAHTVYAEDTRVSRKLMDRYGIKAPLKPYHDHNADAARPRILAALEAGHAVALVSDAGTPLVSDPGYKLVCAAVEAGHAVTALPGASAVLAALVVSALPSDTFTFAGFLPNKETARLARIDALKDIPGTLVFFESGPRLAAGLGALAQVLGPRPAAIARELTKRFEEVRRADLAHLAAQYRDEDPPKGEIVIIVGPPEEESVTRPDDIDAALADALDRLSLKDAVAAVSGATGAPRKSVYARALVLTKAGTS